MKASLPITTDLDQSSSLSSIRISPTEATILASYNCTAACQHCCFDSHPGIKKRLTLEQILWFIDKANEFPKMKLIVFSGGECFLLGKDLDIAIKHATELGLTTRCVTNGYWATSYQMAVSRLSKKKEAGLTEINFSTGDFHQKYVPQENIINGAVASVELGISTVIVIEMQKQRRITRDYLRTNSHILNLMSNKLFKIIESPWMPMSLGETVEQRTEKYLSINNLYNKKGCDSILNNIVATPNGQMGLCCGLTRELIPELNVEMPITESLQEVYNKAIEDFMKIWIYVEGPEKILAWAGTKDSRIQWQGKYAHHCHACLALYKDELVRNAIKNHYNEKVPDVLLRYYLQIWKNNIKS